MARKETQTLEKKDWVQRFTLVGEAKINDFTFKMNQASEKSDWVWNQLNLNVACGEKAGNVSCELMGGYGSDRDNIVYVHGKKEDGSDDFENRYTIDWEDRFDADILADIGKASFLTVGLEKTDKDETFYNKFLTPYDAIAYIKEHLVEGMVIRVTGDLRYSVYNDNVQCKKEIKSIVLSSATPDKYKATFTQTILIDQDSCTADSLDKDKSSLVIDAYVLEKFKEFNGYDLTENGKTKGMFVPLKKQFEFPVDLTTEAGKAKVKVVKDKLFKVKKDVTQITFEGEFVETGAAVQATWDDVPADIKELVDMGLYTEEEALAKCSVNGGRDRRMFILKPMIKMVGKDEEKVPEIQRIDEKFKSETLIMECLSPKDKDEDEDEDVDDVDTDDVDEDTTEEASADDDAWLNAL